MRFFQSLKQRLCKPKPKITPAVIEFSEYYITELAQELHQNGIPHPFISIDLHDGKMTYMIDGHVADSLQEAVDWAMKE